MLSLLLFVFSQTQLLGQGKLFADVQVYHFQTPNDEVYAEFYLGILSEYLKSKPNGDQGVIVTFTANQGGETRFADKFQLNRDAASETDFYHVDRVVLLPGAYEFIFDIEDIADDKNVLRKSLEVRVPNPQSDICISSLQLSGNVVESSTTSSKMSKSGLLIEPLKYKYLNNNYKNLNAYFEVYNSSTMPDEHFFVQYALIHKSALQSDTVWTKIKRKKCDKAVAVLLQEKNDTNWLSGDYILSVQVLNKKEEMLASTMEEFKLSNPYMTHDKIIRQKSIDQSFVKDLTNEALNIALRGLAAKIVSEDVERLNYLISQGDRVSQESFVHRFWTLYNPIDPYDGFVEYMKVVEALDDRYYDGLGRGFETDRGYIYLKYGQPDQILTIEDEPTAPPYEIWKYDNFAATNQRNVKFIFYNRIASTFQLLHSTARGELNDDQWLLKLYSNSPGDVVGDRADATRVSNYFHRRAEEYFEEN